MRNNNGSPKKTDLKIKNNGDGDMMNGNKTDVLSVGGGSHSHHGHHSHHHYDVYGHEIGGLSPRGLVHGGLGKSQQMRYNYNVRRFHEFVVPSK